MVEMVPEDVAAAGGLAPIDPPTTGGSCHVSAPTTCQMPPVLTPSTLSPVRTAFGVDRSFALVAAPSIRTRTWPVEDTAPSVTYARNVRVPTYPPLAVYCRNMPATT